MAGGRIRVLLLRGRNAAPWNLRMWEQLPERFGVSVLVTAHNAYDLGDVRVEQVGARSFRNLLPGGRLGDLAMALAGDRYLGANEAFAAADIVHSEELGYWHSGDAARRKPEGRFKLVVTTWETIPLGASLRNPRARRNRERALAAADLFLPTTERARSALLLEGVPEDRLEVCYPGIDAEGFAVAAPAAQDRHVIISPGRLVWEKGHQDVLRAMAALREGLVAAPAGAEPRLLLVGSGPEESRLRAYAEELGIADLVEIRSVPYEEMPEVFAEASCMVLASLANSGCSRYLGDLPRCFWEEQFGMVIAEALAAGVPIVASRSGAIPEVAGNAAEYFSPGGWLELAERLAEGPLSRPPAMRADHPRELVERYSIAAAAERLAAAYDRVLGAASARS